MIQVYKNLWVGDDSDCKQDFAVVHACKSCFFESIPYDYLINRKGKDLFLNLVDAPKLIPKYNTPIIHAVLNFMNENSPVLIHCNKGESRSPSIAMLYMAIKGYIPNETYGTAYEAFKDLYPPFCPNKGITKYLLSNWRNYVR